MEAIMEFLKELTLSFPQWNDRLEVLRLLNTSNGCFISQLVSYYAIAYLIPDKWERTDLIIVSPCESNKNIPFSKPYLGVSHFWLSIQFGPRLSAESMGHEIQSWSTCFWKPFLYLESYIYRCLYDSRWIIFNFIFSTQNFTFFDLRSSPCSRVHQSR